MMRPAGRIVFSCFWKACGRAAREYMNEICALFHVREAVSAAVLRRKRMFRTMISRGDAMKWSCGAFGRAARPTRPQKRHAMQQQSSRFFTEEAGRVLHEPSADRGRAEALSRALQRQTRALQLRRSLRKQLLQVFRDELQCARTEEPNCDVLCGVAVRADGVGFIRGWFSDRINRIYRIG